MQSWKLNCLFGSRTFSQWVNSLPILAWSHHYDICLGNSYGLVKTILFVVNDRADSSRVESSSAMILDGLRPSKRKYCITHNNDQYFKIHQFISFQKLEMWPARSCDYFLWGNIKSFFYSATSNHIWGNIL